MIFDSKLMFNARTAGVDVPFVLTASTATLVFTDLVDLKSAHKNQGKPLQVGVRFVTKPTVVTAGITGQFLATHCATVGGTYTPCGESATIEAADMDPGKEIKINLSEDVFEFVKLSIKGVGALGVGTVLAGMIS